MVRQENDPQPIIADGSISGKIVDTPRGNNGFGYDPHFYLEKYSKTVAELDPVLKNQISHRRMATEQLINKLKFLSNNLV